MTDWQRDLEDARATVEELTRERDEARDEVERLRLRPRAALLNALMSIRDEASSDRGYPLIDRIYELANRALSP